MPTIAPPLPGAWRRLSPLAMLAALLLALFVIPTAHAQTGPPAYQLQYLGPGSPVAINNSGTVAGARLNGNNYDCLLYTSRCV